MKPTIDSSAQAWVNYCEAQAREINRLEKENARLEDMLSRTLVFANAMILDHPGYKMPKDIEIWWQSYKIDNQLDDNGLKLDGN